MGMALRSLMNGSILGATLLVASAGSAADGLRCDSKLVSLGDSTYEVRSLCGVPQDQRQRTERQTVRRAVRVPCAAGTCVVMVDDTIEVSVEEWTYDFGPHRFIQFLRFEQGVLARVQSGGYGTRGADTP